jgi:hypothetical protein
MADVESVFSSDSKELESIFGMDDEKREKVAGIRHRIRMPDPAKENDSVTVRVLYYQKPDGTVQLYKTVKGEKFRSTAVFLNVEDVNMPGVQKDLSLSKTLYQSIDRELYNRGLKWEDLPGKVLTITADYWTSAPRNKRSATCMKCNGSGCDFCTVTGTGEDAGIKTGLNPPTRYDAVIRDDLSNVTKTKTEAVMEF